MFNPHPLQGRVLPTGELFIAQGGRCGSPKRLTTDVEIIGIQKTFVERKRNTVDAFYNLFISTVCGDDILKGL